MYLLPDLYCRDSIKARQHTRVWQVGGRPQWRSLICNEYKTPLLASQWTVHRAMTSLLPSDTSTSFRFTTAYSSSCAHHVGPTPPTRDRVRSTSPTWVKEPLSTGFDQDITQGTVYRVPTAEMSPHTRWACVLLRWTARLHKLPSTLPTRSSFGNL